MPQRIAAGVTVFRRVRRFPGANRVQYRQKNPAHTVCSSCAVKLLSDYEKSLCFTGEV
jgi:ribosomal protein L34E